MKKMRSALGDAQLCGVMRSRGEDVAGRRRVRCRCARVWPGAAKAAASDLQGAQAFLQAFFLEGVRRWPWPSPTLFIWVGELGVGLREFSRRRTRGILVTTVIDARLEAGGGFAGDVVLKLVEQVADGELGGDLCDGEAGWPWRRGAEELRENAAGSISMMTMRPVSGSQPKLDVGAAGSPRRRRGMTAKLWSRMIWYSLSGRGLDGGDGDGVAGVDAHGVEILDGADDGPQLSARSRMTSISYSFQPRRDSSMRISLTGESSMPFLAMASNSSWV